MRLERAPSSRIPFDAKAFLTAMAIGSKPRVIAVASMSIMMVAGSFALFPGFSPAGAQAQEAAGPEPGGVLGGLLPPGRTTMGFTSHIIYPGTAIIQDLYEPTITIANSPTVGPGSTTGTMYVTGHVTGAYSTGTPSFVSNDGGATWRMLPIVSTVAMPGRTQGSSPPGGDEGVIVADANGHAWLVDAQDGVTMSVTGWCGNGASSCYYQPDVYNNLDGALCTGIFFNEIGSLGTDRPWAAEAKVGSSEMLLMVNNGYLGTAGNVAQIGLLDVTPGLPAGAVPPTWNPCTSGGNVAGYIPGPPALSTGGRFVVPQIQFVGTAPVLKAITGTVTGGVLSTTTTTAFSVVNTLLACSSNYGFATVSNSGTFFLAAADTANNKQIQVAATTSGTSFKTGSFTTTDPVAFMWITGSMTGEGALLSWAEAVGGSCSNVSFHAVHVTLSATGYPQFSDSSTVVTGTSPCGDLMGSSVGRDGNSAVVVFSHPNQCLDEPLPFAAPLKVYAQTSGTKL
jgi:hypothetical protein